MARQRPGSGSDKGFLPAIDHSVRQRVLVHDRAGNLRELSNRQRSGQRPDASGDFWVWFDVFLPGLAEGRPGTLLAPARVSDRSDGKIAHLDGLNLSRGWCWREVAAGLAEADPRRAVGLEAAQTHLDTALEHVTGDYMGEHWLASFALLALLAQAAEAGSAA